MAGLLGFVGGNAACSGMRRACEALEHDDRFESQIIWSDEQVNLGVVSRRAAQFSAAARADHQVFVALYGYCLSSGPGGWRRQQAQDLLSTYRAAGTAMFSSLDGSFVIVVLDHVKRRLYIANDHYGSLSVCYTSQPGIFAFAPEAKALFSLTGSTPAVDTVGALQFLNVGHVFGGKTLFEGVRRLTPASYLNVCLEGATSAEAPYWRPDFRSSSKLSLGEAAAAFNEAVNESQAALERVAEGRVWIALTGGFDSRLVLGTLPPQVANITEAFSWGTSDRIVGSDPAIARSLASQQGIPFRFVRYGHESVPRNWCEWIRTSELVSDNLGYIAAGQDFLGHGSDLPDMILTGDHLVGLAGMPGSRSAAIESVTYEPYGGLHPCLAPLVHPVNGAGAAEQFQKTLEDLVLDCPSDEPRDLQDYLFLYLHAPGWLWSPGFYKEPMAFAFRPLLLGPVREIMFRMPAAVRSDKRVLVESVRRYCPQIMGPPLASANTAIDWRYHSRNDDALRELLARWTGPDVIHGSCLDGLIDRDSFIGHRARFFAEEPRPVVRSASYSRQLTHFRSLVARSGRSARVVGAVAKALGGLVGGRRYQLSAGANHRIMFRIAQVLSFESMVRSGRFASTRDRSEGDR